MVENWCQFKSWVELPLYLPAIPYIFAFVIQYFISTEVRNTFSVVEYW